MPAPEKWIESLTDKLAPITGMLGGSAPESATQTELELAYDAYIASVQTFNLVYANRQPMDITIPDWPDLAPNASIQCALAYILTLGAFIQMATHCINKHHPDDVATQDCIDHWHGLTTAAIAGCVAEQ